MMIQIRVPVHPVGYFCGVAIAIVALLFGGCGQALAASTAWGPSASPDLEIFVREGCSRCADAESFVEGLRRRQPDLRVAVHDVRRDPTALARLQELAASAGAAAPGLPSFYVRGELLVGFAGESTSGAHIEALLAGRPEKPAPSATTAMSCAQEANLTCSPGPAAAADSVEWPWLGIRIDVEKVGLPLFTMATGLVDGFNPCSMWVLIMMVSILAATRDRRKMLAIAGTFVVVEGFAYFAFMAAWLNLFLLIGISRTSQVALGIVALVAGLINIKDFWAFGRGITLSIPAAAKPGIYAKIRRILQEENLFLAVAGTAALAILVQIVELLCTSGFPALYTRILTLRDLDPWAYYGYLLLYNAMYMLDDVAVLAIGVVTLSQRRLQEKEGRRLKLLSGIVMLLLGLYLITAPR